MAATATAASAVATVPVRHAVVRPDYKAVCRTHPAKGQVTCFALVRTNVTAYRGVQPRTDPPGYGPADLKSAYKLPSGGTGQTVAVVDAYDDPSAESDLAVYRTQFGLPACTTANGCFKKVNENGASSPLPPESGSTGWATEESLDIDMVSAACPLCHIDLVEGDAPSLNDLGTAVDSAVALGAKYVSNSYGAGDFSGESAEDTFYNHPGVAVTASAGDDGYGVSYPAASPDVVAVGGTSLTTGASPRGWAETVWGDGTAGDEGTGSGCSANESKPSWQTDTGCAGRTDNDVAAVADPNTGVAVYDTYDEGGWLVVGGTSASSPFIASVYALAGPPSAGSYPADYLYAQHSSANIYDVTSGSNGSCAPAYLCTGEAGYDGPTGWGTPDGTAAFQAPVTIPPGSGPIVSGVRKTVCVDDNGDSSANDTRVVLAVCNGSAEQDWTVKANGTIKINGKCMDIHGAGTANKTPVDLWTCSGHANQVWHAVNGTLVNPVSGKCLDDPRFAITAGTQLEIYTCNGGTNQQWKLPAS
jgi:Ricin-type beta-trefoil lectin domain